MLRSPGAYSHFSELKQHRQLLPRRLKDWIPVLDTAPREQDAGVMGLERTLVQSMTTEEPHLHHLLMALYHREDGTVANDLN